MKPKETGVVNIITGLGQIFVALVFLYVIMPRLLAIFNEFAVAKIPEHLYAEKIMQSIFLLGLVNLFIGIKLIGERGPINNRYEKVGSYALFISYIATGLAVAYSISTIISPIYSLTSIE